MVGGRRNVLECHVEDEGLDVCGGHRAKICRTMECQQIICVSSTIRHRNRRLGELDVIFRPQHRSSRWGDIDKGRIVEHKLNSNELDVFLAATNDSTICNGQKNRGVSHVSRVGHDVALGVMEAQNRQLGEVKPTIIEETEPIIDGAIDRRDEVELSA